MKGITVAIWTESLKVRRSKILPASMLIFLFIAVMMGLLTFFSKHPELAGRSATISAKASIVGVGDWPSYLDLLIQSILALGQMGFGIVTSWVFGREYSDHVIKDLLALPVSRFTIVLSKFIVIAVWCILLSLIMFVSGLLAGIFVGIPGWTGENAYHAFIVFACSSVLTILLCTPVALIASIGRGYLAPIGFVLITLITTQFIGIGIPGITPYFPWVIPALYSGLAGAQLPQPSVASYVILLFTSLSGFIGTVAWWLYADQT